MTKVSDTRRNSLGVEDLHPPFKPAFRLQGENLELQLSDTFLYSNEQIPGYEFKILIDGEEAGRCTALIERDFDKLPEDGNIGMDVNRKFYGRDLPAKAVQAMLPLLQEHGVSSVLITCYKDNRAIQKACEILGAQFLDTMETVEKAVQKERYVLNV